MAITKAQACFLHMIFLSSMIARSLARETGKTLRVTDTRYTVLAHAQNASLVFIVTSFAAPASFRFK